MTDRLGPTAGELIDKAISELERSATANEEAAHEKDKEHPDSLAHIAMARVDATTANMLKQAKIKYRLDLLRAMNPLLKDVSDEVLLEQLDEE